jgi:mono/diheme cytochrome c family protein
LATKGIDRRRPERLFELIIALCLLALLAACEGRPPALTPEQRLIVKGREIFFKETFNGNGRTCGSCHRAEKNFTIDPVFIASLPKDDPLFAAEFIPELSKNFENPRLMRGFGLILENLDGFGDLDKIFTQRGVPHTLALRTSVVSPNGPRTGWSGDGAPRDGSLKAFAIGAVIQHFTRTLNRIPGVDFRLPEEEELQALEAFQLALGRQEDLKLPLPLQGTIAKRGQEVFLNDSLGKCNLCHRNAGANARLGGRDIGNANFNTGVEALVDQPIDQIGELVPPDDGFGVPGDGTFNTPPLVEAADTGPFFHNDSIDTIEGAVAFYNGAAFNNSPSGRFLAGTDPNGVGIRLEATQVVAVAAFLRVVNALENIRASTELIEGALGERFAVFGRPDEHLRLAGFEIADGIKVLQGANLHPQAVVRLRSAKTFAENARGSVFRKKRFSRSSLKELEEARKELIGS